jgi:anti-anti-sigma regulatory factor
MLVALHVSANSQSAELHLSNLGGKFKEVLQLTRLVTVFNVYDTEAEAIRGFRPAAISA